MRAVSASGIAGMYLRGSELASDRPPPKGDKPADKDHQGKKERDEAMGAALRSVYHAAASEPVPDQMLDLLNKLG